MWNPSYNPDYFSLLDILAEQERIPVVTNEDLPKLGFLDPSTSSRNGTLNKGTKLELPLWMAKSLKARNRAQLNMPPNFSDKKRQIVAADPDAVNLHNYGPHFYESGKFFSSFKLHMSGYALEILICGCSLFNRRAWASKSAGADV